MGPDFDFSSGQEPFVPEVIMTPQALLWVQELEQANAHLHPAHFWRDAHGKSMRRLNPMKGMLDWPGLVHVPSCLLEKDLSKGNLKVPARWSRVFSLAEQAQLMSTLIAWELDRGIYRLTPRTALLVSNCQVNAPLALSMFETLPAQGIYMELKPHTEHAHAGAVWDDSMPVGFFASIDQSTQGPCQLVLLMDRQNHLDVHSVPLDGRTIDEMAVDMLIKARHQSSGSRVWAETEVRETTALLHTAISALLMTCINRHRMNPVEAVNTTPFVAVRQPWMTWEVGHGIDNQIEVEMTRNETLGRTPMLVGHWCNPLGKESIRLQFAAGCQLHWDALDKRMSGRN